MCREYTRAEDQDWHLDHFCCLYCDQGLGGKQYRPQNGQPYCLECFEVAFSSICEVGIIAFLQTRTLFHPSPVFLYSFFLSCPLPLFLSIPIPSFCFILRPFSFPHSSSFSPFYFSLNSPPQTCGNQVTLDQPRLKHEDLIWHGTDECFVCAFCSLSLLGQPYLPRHGKVFCSKDHAKQFKSKSKKNKA